MSCYDYYVDRKFYQNKEVFESWIIEALCALYIKCMLDSVSKNQ